MIYLFFFSSIAGDEKGLEPNIISGPRLAGGRMLVGPSERSTEKGKSPDEAFTCSLGSKHSTNPLSSSQMNRSRIQARAPQQPPALAAGPLLQHGPLRLCRPDAPRTPPVPFLRRPHGPCAPPVPLLCRLRAPGTPAVPSLRVRQLPRICTRRRPTCRRRPSLSPPVMAIVAVLLALGAGAAPAGRPPTLLEGIPSRVASGPLAAVHGRNQTSAAA
jgi:hypothetical protein